MCLTSVLQNKLFSILFTSTILTYSNNCLAGDILFSENFDDSSSLFFKKILAHPNTSIVQNGGKNNNTALKVKYIGTNRGSERVILHHKLSKIVSSAKLTYRVKFSENFSWGLGGKMHGLGSSSPITGGQQRNNENWSYRLMFNPNGYCSAYVYEQSRDKKWGLTFNSDNIVFKKGKWHVVELALWLNSQGIKNGRIVIKIDGQEVINNKNITFRSVDTKNSLISKLLFNTFHGGHTKEWAPKDETGHITTVTALFDDFLVEEIPEVFETQI
jgi:hypothetical protein